MARREIQASFVSPIAYAFMVAFLLILALAFNFFLHLYTLNPPSMFQERGASVRTVLVGGPNGIVAWAQVAILVSLPGLAMRLFSEERKTGTAELLLTSPVTTAELVAGKFLGAFAVFAILLGLTFPLVGVLAWKAQLEWPALGCAYAGLALFGAVVLAVGLFSSVLTEAQFVALILTYAILMPLLFIPFVVGLLGSPWDDILMGLNLRQAVRQFGLGLVDSHYVVLFGVLVGGFLFLSARVLDSPRWR